MPDSFDLVLTPNPATFTADLHLRDAHGSQLAYRNTDFNRISVSHRDGLFNLRSYLELLVEGSQQAAGMAEIGVCIAQQVLGPELFELLARSAAPRTLRIQLPSPAADNALAAQLARVPWEIARRAPDQPTLAERHLLVRVVNSLLEPATPPLALGPDEPLRVLFVFAEARGARPLEARRERRELLQLFKTSIYPKRRVVAAFLSHGVTRARLEAQVRENGGYHIVHWSGHGSQNRLELARPGGGADSLTGAALLDLFNEAGGFLPQLIFLSACNSGSLLRVQDWNDLLAVAQGQRPASEAPELAPAATQPGYTGTAHALLAGDVPSVVAMRYAVGDTYARRLAVAFYEALLAYEKPQPVAAALLTARQQLRQQPDQASFAPCDHATPVLYGASQPDLAPPPGRSPALGVRSPRLGAPLPELSIAGHAYFVGRTWELAGLGADFIGTGAGVRPVAVVTGLGGMGKTAFIAEALDLWEQRFSWVLLYQAKPNALHFELTLRDIHLKLLEDSNIYSQYIGQYHADAVYREASDTFTGEARLDRLTRNLLRALQDEAILLVLDNFEANLRPTPEPGPGSPRWACQDPAWDRCLAQLAAGLAASPSRVLITSRWPLAALAEGTYCPVPLGPLPASEAALYVRSHPGLLPLALGADKEEARLVERLLNASRLHPLLLDRLARLATGDPALRPPLLEALAALEAGHDYSQLPTLFAVERGDTRESAYLQDALATSLDLLLGQAGPEARRLLWLIALANEPITYGLLEAVWRGETPEYAQQRQTKGALANMAAYPPDVQARLRAIPPEVQAELDALPLLPVRPAIAPLLRHLLAVGLATAQRDGPEDENPDLSCHELVRERIRPWLADHPLEAEGQTENSIRLAYAEWLEDACVTLLHQNLTHAIEACRQAAVYYSQAGAYERLDKFVSDIVTSHGSAQVAKALLPYLAQATQATLSWLSYGQLADALSSAGQPQESLPYYERAALLAQVAAEASGDAAQTAWRGVSWIASNWASALLGLGRPHDARLQLQASAEASKKAGHPAVYLLAAELEIIRLDSIQGPAEALLPTIEARLAQLQAWWQQSRAGQPVPEAPDTEILARALLSALDIARLTDRNRGDWAASLRRTDAMLAIERDLARSEEEITSARMDRAVELTQLGRAKEAKAELEDCLQIFATNPLMRSKVLGSIASLFNKQGDFVQAVIQERRSLAICEQLPDPTDRAISHGNLAAYLDSTALPENLAAAPRHQLACLLYCFVMQVQQSLQELLRNYTINYQRAQAAGTSPFIPRLSELLTDPAFYPLAEWLRERQIDTAQLQAGVDDFLEQARQAAAHPA